MRRLSFLLCIWLLTACGSAAPVAEVPLPSEASPSVAPMVSPTVGSTPVAVASPTLPPTATATLLPPTPTPDPTPDNTPTLAVVQVVGGRTDAGVFFLGDPDAPVTLIDYSDFLWPSCRAHVLGTEPQIVQTYVESGQVKLVFWPVLNHGTPSVYATVTAVCVGQQDPVKFWDVHAQLFQNQTQLWSATRDDFIATAVAAGADQAAFEACYDSPETLTAVMDLDATRRERGVFSQPVFDINGQILAGAQPFDVFTGVIDAALEESTP